MNREQACARYRALLLLVLTALLSACAAAPQTQRLQDAPPPNLASNKYLGFVPFFPQQLYQCGPAALATVLNAAAVRITPDELVSQVYIPARQGSLQVEMLAAARRSERLAHVIPGTLEAVLGEVAAERSVLVMQNLGLRQLPQWHYAVVVGYNLDRAEITLRSGTIRDYVLPIAVFERTWARAGHWAVVVLPSGEIPVSISATDYFMAVAEFERLHPQLSEAAWREGMMRWPGSEILAMGMSNWLFRAGQVQASATILENLLEERPDYRPAQQNLTLIRQVLSESEVL